MEYDIIIIGAGPAGYPAAACALRQGLRTLLVEGDELGGTCLNRGCIPTKTLCRSARVALEARGAAEFGIELPGAPAVDLARIIDRKNEVVAQLRLGVEASVSGADIVSGTARFTAPRTIEVGGESYTAPKIIVATGSEPARLDIPGADLCLTSTELLDNRELPSSLAVIGGGVIGLEFASVFAAFGTEVTVIEFCKEILPGFDKDIAKRLRSALSARGIKFILNAAATAVEETPGGFRISYEAKGKPGEAEASRVLMAVGRRARIPEGMELNGAEISRRGIVTDAGFQTTIPGVYAVGDCNGICQLAHAATAQALKVMGADTDLSPVPAAVFTEPEAASTGLTEEQAKEQGLAFRTVKLPVRSNGKALAMGETDGLLKLILSAEDSAAEAPLSDGCAKASGSRILGCHILGPHASDLIMEASLAISAGLPASALLRAIHPHPTLSELLHEALSR